MEYFEELADLLEDEMTLDFIDVYEAVKGSTSEDVGEILENYLEELMEAIPDNDNKLYMLVENIKTGLLFLCENLEDDKTLNKFAEELCRFKNWYTGEMICTINGKKASLMEASAEWRANKLTGGESTFVFNDDYGFELKDYEMTIGDFSEIDVPEEEEIDLASFAPTTLQ